MDTSLKPLLGKDVAELKEVAAQFGLPKYTAGQIAGWLYDRKVRTIAEMTNLSKAARESLSQCYAVGCSDSIDEVKSEDGTCKYLFPASGEGYVETVYIPEGERATVCVSSQAGCKMHCAFCLTGKGGFKSQLSVSEILNQYYSLPGRDSITNIVFMGQGEPLDNYDSVRRAIEILTSDKGFAMSPRRITLSTCGVLPKLRMLVRDSNVNIAISLHSPFHAEREEIMAIEKAYPIEDVVKFLKSCEEFRDTRGKEVRTTSHQRRLSFEYVLLRGKNDTAAHVNGLVSLLKGLDCRVNVIPLHTYKGCTFSAPTQEDCEHFCRSLNGRGLNATMRRSRGKDIYAACGMLASKRRGCTD